MEIVRVMWQIKIPQIGSTTLCLSTRWRSSYTSRPPRQRHFWERLVLIVNLWNENLNMGATCISSLRTNNPSFSEYFLPLSISRNHMNTTSWTKKETFEEYFLMTHHSPTIDESVLKISDLSNILAQSDSSRGGHMKGFPVAYLQTWGPCSCCFNNFLATYF